MNFHFSARLVFASLSPFILTLPSPPCNTGQLSDVDVDDYGGGGENVYTISADKSFVNNFDELSLLLQLFTYELHNCNGS